MKRIQFNVSEDRLELIDKLKDDLGFSSRTELFNTSITLLRWARRQVDNGYHIAAYKQASGPEQADTIIQVAMPGLIPAGGDHPKPKSENEPQSRDEEPQPV